MSSSSRVIVHGGEVYAPIKDLASALSMTVQARADGYALMRPGGGMQMAGLTGKIGDDLFNGSFRLMTLSVTRTSDYKPRLSSGGEVIAPEGQDIVAVAIRLKNGTPKTRGVMVLGNPATLTDEDEHTYDLFYGDSPARNVELLPGSAVDAILTFRVPKNAFLKDLVYKDLVYKVDCPLVPGQAFRMSLKKP